MTVAAELEPELVGDYDYKNHVFPLADCTKYEFIQHKRKNYKGGTGLEAFMKKVLSQALGKSVRFTLIGETALKVSW